MVTVKEIRAAKTVLRQFLSPTPLIRSFKLEKQLGLQQLGRRVYIKDYGWTPVGRLVARRTGTPHNFYVVSTGNEI